MKKILILGTTFMLFITTASIAQTINWQSLKPQQKHLANINTGLDYATSFGIGYGYQLNIKIPVVLQVQASVPAGDEKLDDFKTKLGGQVRVYKTGNWIATTSVYSIFRAHKTDMVKMQSFGSEFTAIAGYYRPKWFSAMEFGFDKAIATHIKHTDLMKEYFPQAQDGWYVPTGGNFNVGILGGYTIKTFDVTVKAGRTWDQRFQLSAIVPYYFQLGLNKRF